MFVAGFDFVEIDSMEPKRLDMKIVRNSLQLSASFNYFIYFEQIKPFY